MEWWSQRSQIELPLQFKFEGSEREVKMQATLAVSTAEAEYQGMAAAVQEAIFLRALLKDLDFRFPMKRPIDSGDWRRQTILH